MTRISKLTKLSCAILLSSSAMSMEMTKEQQLMNLQQLFKEVDRDTLEDVYDSQNGNMGQIFDFFQPEKIHAGISKKEQEIENIMRQFRDINLDPNLLSELYDENNGDTTSIQTLFRQQQEEEAARLKRERLREEERLQNIETARRQEEAHRQLEARRQIETERRQEEARRQKQAEQKVVLINQSINPANNDLATQLMNINGAIKEVREALESSRFLQTNTKMSINNEIKSITNEYSEIKKETIKNINNKLIELKNEIKSLNKQKNNLPSKYAISHNYHIKRMSLFDEFKDYPDLRSKWNEKYNQEEAKEIESLNAEINSINKKISSCETKQESLNHQLHPSYNREYIIKNTKYWIDIGFEYDFIDSIYFIPSFCEIYQEFLEQRIYSLKNNIIRLNEYNKRFNETHLWLSNLNKKKENIERQIFAIEDEKRKAEAERLEIQRRAEAERLETQRKAEEERRRIEAKQLEIQRRAEAERLETQRKAEEEKRRMEIEQLEIDSINQILNTFEMNNIESTAPNWADVRDQLIQLTNNINTLSWKDELGNTLLHLASGKGSIGSVVVSGLINKFPNMINHPSNNGSTPLHLAAFSGNEGLIGYMLRHGADVFAKSGNNQDITVLDAAANWLEGCIEEGNEQKIKNAKDIIDIILNALFSDDNGKGKDSDQGNNPPVNMNILYVKDENVRTYIRNKITEHENARIKRERDRMEQERLHREEQERMEYARLQQQALKKKKQKEEEARRRQEDEDHYQRNRQNTRQYYNYS